MTSKYYTTLTAQGIDKLSNAALTSDKVQLTTFAVGDGNGSFYSPSGNETILKNEKWRGNISAINIDPTDASLIKLECAIPANVGGFTVREIGIFDDEGTLIAIGNYPDTPKTIVNDGVLMDMLIYTVLKVSNAAVIDMEIDPSFAIASRNFVAEQIEQFMQYNVKDFGAIGDGVTDDTQAFLKLVNVLSNNNKKAKVTIPKGNYLLSSTIHFENEVEIVGDENTWINYNGTGIVFKLGKDGITQADYQNYKRFEVKNVGFIGGENMSYGIYSNKFVTQPRILNCNFMNFGNPTAWGIYFDDDCWDGLVQGCRWDANDNKGRNFIGMYGRGNSRVRAYDNLITSLSGIGTAVYINGFNGQVSRNKIEGFHVCVRLGGLASYAQVTDNYFEKSGAVTESGCIEIGSVTGDNGESATPINIVIERNYCNTHLANLAIPSYFIRPTKTTDLIKDIVVRENYVNSYNNGGLTNEMVKQNNLGGQTGNVADDNRFLNIDKLHTIGSNITNWGGNDGLRNIYDPIADEDRYFDFSMGKTRNNTTGLRILKNDGSVMFSIISNSFNETSVYNNNALAYKLFPNGRMSVGKAGNNAFLDIAGDILATRFRISEQRAATNAENGSLFEDTDGKLKYRNLNGTVYDLTVGG